MIPLVIFTLVLMALSVATGLAVESALKRKYQPIEDDTHRAKETL